MNPPPLTREDLIAIRDGNVRNADVRALLREIRRLRAVLLYAKQYVDCMDANAQHTALIREILCKYLDAEPCVLERQALRKEILNPNTRD